MSWGETIECRNTDRAINFECDCCITQGISIFCASMFSIYGILALGLIIGTIYFKV